MLDGECRATGRAPTRLLSQRKAAKHLQLLAHMQSSNNADNPVLKVLHVVNVEL